MIKKFIDSFPSDSLIGDIGCGNGKNIKYFNDNCNIIGIDNCTDFVNICNDRGYNVIYSDIRNYKHINYKFKEDNDIIYANKNNINEKLNMILKNDKTNNYNIYMHEVTDINKLYSNQWSRNKYIYQTDKGYYEKTVDEDRLPDIIVVDKYENEKNSKQPPFDKGTPKQFTIKNNSKSFTYKLDSAIVRDTKKRHFCAVLTCNKKHYGFDGASFSKISHFNWLDFLNKNKNWTFKGSTWENTDKSILWNFTKSYQILIYYRI